MSTVCFGAVLIFLLFTTLLNFPVFSNVPCIVVAVAEPVRVVGQYPGHPFLGSDRGLGVGAVCKVLG